LVLEVPQTVVAAGFAVAFPAAAVVAVQHWEREQERRERQVAPSMKHQAGLSLFVAELAEVLALIDAAASLQVQHMKALEDWSYWRTALTAEQIQQGSLTVQ
jgi:hypothetical protein